MQANNRRYACIALAVAFRRRSLIVAMTGPILGHGSSVGLVNTVEPSPDGGRLQYHYLKDSNKHWKINDLRDNAALAVTVPYCDIVVTDSAAWNTAVNRAHLDKEFGTAIFRSLTDLAAHLN